MNTIPVTLSMSGYDITVDAYPTAAPGLVIHQAINSVNGDWWSITHENSGWSLNSYLPSPEAALAAAAELGQVADWTQPPDQMGDRVYDLTAEILFRWGAQVPPDSQSRDYP